jgi:MGT family glycosyltransferase
VATIGIVHFPLQGHVGPAARLGGVLASAGHRVVAFAPDPFRAQIEASGAQMRVLGDPLPKLEGSVGPFQLNAGLAAMCTQLMEGLVQGLHEEDVDLIVHDLEAPWGRLAADWLGLRRACSWPMFPPVTAYRSGEAGEPHEDTLALMSWSREAFVRRWGIDLGWDLVANPADLNLLLTTREIAGPGELDESWRFVGPLMDTRNGHWEPAIGEPDGRPLVYMALGTFFSRDAAPFRAALDALADEPVRLLVSTWDHFGPDDLAPVPDNAVVVGRVASSAVLREAAVHITHGGAGSVHESLVFGVPMVGMPQGSDNQHWVDRVVALGVGQIASPDSPDEIRAAVLSLLGDDGARARAQELAERTLAHDGAAIAVTAVEELLD